MSYKLICFDMDGVIFESTNFWIQLHKEFGTLGKGVRLTKKYLHTDYDKLVEEVVMKLWKGKDAGPYYDLVNSVKYIHGVKETFNYIKKRGYNTTIISASTIDLAKRVQEDYGIDYIFANKLVIRNRKVSGEFIKPVGAGKENKAKIIKNLCSGLGISQKEVIYVGDSDTDIEAFKIVGMSIAFNSTSKELKKVATKVVDTHNLSDILRYIP